MGILGYIKELLRTAINSIKSIRKTTHEIVKLSITEQIEIVDIADVAWQKDYNETQKRIPREKWAKFDAMVNDFIDQWDMDRTSSLEEVKFMLRTDPIDLPEDYLDFLRDFDTPRAD
ncbi:hypothetical protein LCGC14_0876610 [marine sediment metagenome]|uniref:Uncharacterized protein n=1 Tax=marine sediment metagenome TaxID=412755 RepID=A0A0F9P839_9ZZZZ|nr:hypothetical protein [bacterium]